jgi:hypothetical protein
VFCAISIDELNKATRVIAAEGTNRLFFMTVDLNVEDSF